MNKDQIVERLNGLIKLDIDASNAYIQAIEKIDGPSINERLMTFREDHERHIDRFNEELLKLEETPPERRKDLKGFLIEGFTSLRSVTGTSGALKAMQTNEKMTNKTYKEANDWEMPAEIHRLIQEFYGDERKHLNYITMKIEELKPAHSSKR